MRIHLTTRRHHLCGFDLNLTYPQTGGTFPTLSLPQGLRAKFLDAAAETRVSATSWREAISEDYAARVLNAPARKRADFHERRETEKRWKRDLSQRANGTIDPWYGCDIFNEMRDYAVNFTFPWSTRLSRIHAGQRGILTLHLAHSERWL